ncbi:MAG: bifunctional 5,10-methylenetetrahydrofolate dehydrogenase/5,10-methenyltetrahydrofolate cyclohydrolase [Candidatus Berkelbacteria bacterium]|nr:bifunctional 5,10-methylenetetrahydrofolate dehydrogenase/5,10-methenyltetrahydrofolate cyclohydrolase [Candidatus Berkelbacteria bacterium]
MFDGKEIRDEILKDLAANVAASETKRSLAVFLVDNDPICAKYVELKQKLAAKIGVQFSLYKFDEKDSEDEIFQAIEFLNSDPETDGIMIQIPLPKRFDRDHLISAISPEKDVDGLRFCAGLDSKFKPPVVLAILEAIRVSKADVTKSKIALIGHGFLVGSPLERILKENGASLSVFRSDSDIHDLTDFDIVISAVGKAGIVKDSMIKEGAVLVDAGTTEQNGSMVGDIDEFACKKAAFSTPVPGGIGPVTVAMLFRNLVEK